MSDNPTNNPSPGDIVSGVVQTAILVGFVLFIRGYIKAWFEDPKGMLVLHTKWVVGIAAAVAIIWLGKVAFGHSELAGVLFGGAVVIIIGTIWDRIEDAKYAATWTAEEVQLLEHAGYFVGKYGNITENGSIWERHKTREDWVREKSIRRGLSAADILEEKRLVDHLLRGWTR